MKDRTIQELLTEYPFLADFFLSYEMELAGKIEWTLEKYIQDLSEEFVEEKGIHIQNFYREIEGYITAMQEFYGMETRFELQSLTILAGRDKQGNPEGFGEITLKPSQIISIVGPTGSGKSRLLADIEWTANADTQTGRRILINGAVPDLSWRYSVTNQLVAQLSQNMNFVIDATVYEFLDMHADCRNIQNKEETIERIIQKANELAGEKFDRNTNVTSLSGGQSRALMIADTAILSPSPIVLIDEIENAGIDRKKALDVLLSEEKIVLMATHDPLLCLMADQRIVIKNGGIHNVITTTPEEKAQLEELWKMDAIISEARRKLRAGEELS